ncbi:PH domain-containing protein [Rhizobium sp. RAF56]|jgi:hypothetical protein|uniref:PH domain-containing protein n=1 Tax=Rhizobium sp. RAF56 TaxID=3233062 RepID=UPI003F97443C
MSGDGVKNRLMSGECVLWAGSPAQGLLFTGRDAFLIPLSMLWLAFTIFWLGTAVATGAPIFFRLWGAMFVAMGLFLLAGRFIVDAWLRSRTSYAVTDQRILIVRSAPFPSVTSIDLDRLPEINLIGDGNPRGHIRFGPSALFAGNRSMLAWVPSLDAVPQFLGITTPSKVFETVMQASRKLRAGLDAGASPRASQ